MAIPAAAKKQIKEANKLHQEIYGGKEEKTPEKSETSDNVIEIESKPDQEKPGAESNDSQKPETTVDKMTPDDVRKEQTSKEEPKKVDTAPDETVWEQRYKTLQGMWKKDVPQLQAENARLQSQIADMERRLQSMETKPPVAESAKETKAERFLTDEDVEEFGPEILDAAKRAAREELNPVVSQLQQENAKLREQLDGVGSTIAQSERQTVLGQMDSQVPGWREQNESPEFLNWLQQPDLYSGQTKQSLLTAAFEEGNVARMRAFFEGFRKETEVVSSEETVPATRSPAVDADKLVSPGTPRSVSAPRSQDGSQKIWTAQDIERFYDDVRAGKYRSDARQKEKTRIEAAIIKAASEGRVR